MDVAAATRSPDRSTTFTPRQQDPLKSSERTALHLAIQDMARGHVGLLRAGVRRAVHRRLGPQAGAGAVLAFSALAAAVLLSTTGPVAIGYQELSRRHRVHRRSLSRARPQLMPPDGAPSTDGLLLRSHRGRLNVATGAVTVSRWYPGDQLLREVADYMRHTLAQPKRAHRPPVRQLPPRPPAAVPPGLAERDTPSPHAAPPDGVLGGRDLWAAVRDQFTPRRRR
jgi:hypothetical protein